MYLLVYWVAVLMYLFMLRVSRGSFPIRKEPLTLSGKLNGLLVGQSSSQINCIDLTNVCTTDADT
jgi:hypothetical protein